MPVINRFTGLDKNNRLRSMVEYRCNGCDEIFITRNDNYKLNPDLCRNCVTKIKQIDKIDNRNTFEICVKILKEKLNIRYKFKGLYCDLSLNDFSNLIQKNCHYCNAEPSNTFNYKQKHFSFTLKYNGLDRINSSKGYIYGNVVSCCKKCNIAKSDLSYLDFLNLIKRIYKNLNLK